MIDKADKRDKVAPKKRSKSASIAIKLGLSLLIAIVIDLMLSSFFETPKMANIRNRNQQLTDNIIILRQQIASSESLLADINHRDHYVYRPLLGIDTLDIPQIYSPYIDSKYSDVDGGAQHELILSTWHKLDNLTRQIYYASLSLDQTQELAENKEEFSLVIPAIWPIDRTKLRKVSSLYGMRKHPKYGYWKMHEGIDLAAPIGTPIYATGNATVTKARWERGYGKLIELNHGFGYRTRYGHLSKIYVNIGDTVQRGDIIGEVGNTGVSSGPHLHYEVRYRASTVNPVNYFNKEMTNESYIDLMNQLDLALDNNGNE